MDHGSQGSMEGAETVQEQPVQQHAANGQQAAQLPGEGAPQSPGDNDSRLGQNPTLQPDATLGQIDAKSNSHRSSCLSVTKQRMKLEAAKVKAVFGRRFADLKIRQAELDFSKSETAARRELLETEEALAIAEAEYNVMEAEDMDNVDVKSNASLKRTQRERTMQFVAEQQMNPNAKEFYPALDHNVTVRAKVKHEQNIPSNVNIKHNHSQQQGNRDESQFATEFSKYLMKKELLMSRFIVFNDSAESYPVWKANFKGITNELGVSSREELDLLVKYLGPNSSVHAQSLRTANANMPDQAVTRIWARLEERYGKPEMIDAALKKKISRFPKIAGAADYHRLYELSDTLSEIESMKGDKQYSALLAQYDTSTGVNQILMKLPYNLQQKWVDRATKYKQSHDVLYPPFHEFVQFVRDMSARCNDPGFCFAQPSEHQFQKKQAFKPVSTYKTDISKQSSKDKSCVLHGPGHPLNACRAFRQKSLDERKKLLKEHKVCYRCCETNAHVFRNCQNEVRCRECNSTNHPTAMHVSRNQVEAKSAGDTNYGGEKRSTRQPQDASMNREDISTKCTALCGDSFAGRSCAKTILVKVFRKEQPEHFVTTYAVHDDQSNRTLGSSQLFDQLQLDGETRQYSLSSCAGNTKIYSRHATNLAVQSINGNCEIDLPNLIECEVPNERSEIPTPEVASHYPHLGELKFKLLPLDSTAEIGLLIGRDVVDAHHVEQQIVGPKGAPFAQKLPLGWVIVGEVCLGQFHRPDINVCKTQLTSGFRSTILKPCDKVLHVKEDLLLGNPEDDLFKTTKFDERIGMSQDDVEFLSVMEGKMQKDESGKFKAPLPFKQQKHKLPNNRLQALQRARSLEASLQKNPKKQKHMLQFMEQIFESGAAELAPPVSPEKECWYLPLFGVYHPRKPDKIRGVFDSSVEFEGHSLNKMLLSGPNMTNSLLGVLLRFRRNRVAIASDIQQMFYSFLVCEEHRDFLRFFWHKNNDPAEALTEYRMTVHVFGNTPSPAVATFGLRKAVENANKDVKTFVERDFYVDDGLTSCATEAEAISLVQKSQQVLHDQAKIKLHKVASNVPEVMDAFPAEDLEKNLRSKNLFADELPMQASLGLAWDLNRDVFVFNLNIPEKPPTRRGVLSAVSSLFDPLGFLTPITITGRILLREITSNSEGWDELLSEDLVAKWENWKMSIKEVEKLCFPRMFTLDSLSEADATEVHVFADASEKAISAVAYVKATFGSEVQTGFLIGKSKLAPQGGTTIPRLELCAAVLATQLAETIIEHLDIPTDCFYFYSDSKVVLGYLNNHSRRFYTYVSNRVQTILRSTKSSQWQYVATQNNPADCGTRGEVPVQEFLEGIWIRGPSFLRKDAMPATSEEFPMFRLVNETEDPELRPEIQVKATKLTRNIAARFERFSSLKSLVRAFCLLKRYCRAWKEKKEFSPCTVQSKEDTETYLIRMAQEDAFAEEIDMLRKKASVPTNSSIISLSPILDERGILRVGGRLHQAPEDYAYKHPVIVPRKSQLAKLLVRYYHAKVQHQGRLMTESSIRANGYWIIGAKRLVTSVLHHCVICRKLRGRQMNQRMSDLPSDRLTPTAPFTAVGADVFGPWEVSARKTRGGHAESKRWAVLFTCLATRAVHIEVLEDMSSSAFINAMRRFVAIRGPVKEVRSDRGTNFVGAIDNVKAKAVYVEKGPVHDYLMDAGIVWLFNPPHSSHMGGVWERLIGIARRILDAMLLNSHAQKLTHEVLCTFMCEVSAIMNSRPVAQISYDADNPEVITPAMLLTQKKEPLQPLTTSTDIREIYQNQWKHVQILSNTFWKRWRDGYLQSLQHRRKWTKDQTDLQEGDVVLLQDKEQHRNSWPTGVVEKVFPSNSDGKVRSAEIRVAKDGKPVKCVRPITELVTLFRNV